MVFSTPRDVRFFLLVRFFTVRFLFFVVCRIVVFSMTSAFFISDTLRYSIGNFKPRTPAIDAPCGGGQKRMK